MTRYLGNKNTKEVHDLNQKTAQCRISEIKEAVYFSSLQEAKNAGYDRCAHCLGQSTR